MQLRDFVSRLWSEIMLSVRSSSLPSEGSYPLPKRLIISRSWCGFGARGGSLYQKKVVLLLGLRDELTYLLGTEKKMLDLAGQNAICCDPCRWVK